MSTQGGAKWIQIYLEHGAAFLNPGIEQSKNGVKAAIQEGIRLVVENDEVIERHGGWPVV